MPYDSPLYDFLFIFHCSYFSILHRFRDIIAYFPKFKDHVTVTLPIKGTVCNPNAKTLSGEPVNEIRSL